ncbi:hypothetical protein Slin15195_G022370 [Septoria linicola]|uniref:Uncharacterized protein n=1 Tax=Septoria linicola TaxID=215465 RepID=A0A9Q9EH39_9PEZI|nr:hypothetical protein Slin14017_G021410 [Septoria linicola]USW48918.1 hypothetical protein Slin15195_G022370 [Septoria linicola]
MAIAGTIDSSLLDLVRRNKKRFSGYLPMKRDDDMEMLLKSAHSRDISTDTSCTHEPSMTVTTVNRSIKKMVKTAYRVLSNSDAGLRLRERIYQSPEYNMSSTESDLLGEVLHQIMLEIAGYTDELWHVVQSMIVVHDGTHLELRKIHRSGCSALRRVYSHFADSEDSMGAYIAPRSAPAWLVTTRGSNSSFGATSWYTVHGTCRVPGQQKPLGFDIKVGISVAAESQYGAGLVRGEEMTIKCLTPSLIPNLGSLGAL